MGMYWYYVHLYHAKYSVQIHATTRISIKQIYNQSQFTFILPQVQCFSMKTRIPRSQNASATTNLQVQKTRNFPIVARDTTICDLI